MDAFLVYLIVDYFFGGKGQTHVKPEGRDFTPVQLRIIKKLLLQSLVDLEKAWHAVVPIKVEYVRSESNPQFAMVVTASEIVVVVTLQVIFGETARELYVDLSLQHARADQREALFRSRLRSCRSERRVESSIPRATARVSASDCGTAGNRHGHGEGRDEFFTG